MLFSAGMDGNIYGWPIAKGGSQLERTMDFWNRLWRAAGDNQLAMIGQAQESVTARLIAFSL